MANLVVHFEIHASDPQRLVDFYAELLGWRFQRWGDFPYWTIDTGEGAIGNVAGSAGHGINGGLTQREGPSPEVRSPINGCRFVVGVDGDVDGLMRRGIELGGREAVAAADMPGVGRVGYLLDPDNNVFGLISAVMSDGTTAMGGSMTEVAERNLDQLRRSFHGEIIAPADAGYDDARRLWNAVHDRRPAVILRPTHAREVATAIHFGREHDLEIAIRSGGHSKAGLGGPSGGLVVDMSSMRGVEVDPRSRVARVNGGALLGELDVSAQAHGLVCPIGVVGHTGVAGLTLGGGVGRLQRHFGLTIDNLAAVELVTADGRHVRASETEEPELFWGLRGAGWNFGIATAFEFRLHPFGPDLHRGLVVYPASQVHDVWDAFRTYAAKAPDEVALILNIDRAGEGAGYPDELVGKPVVYAAYNHSGAAADVERDTAGLHAGPKPIATTIGSQPYLDVQTAHDLVFAWGSRSFIRGCNGDDVRPEALDELVEMVATAPGESSFSVTALGGAIGRVPEDATAYAGRSARFDLSADTSWTDPTLDDANMDWCRRAMAVVAPDAVLGCYANGYADAGPDATRAIYGDAKLGRLVALKRAWDPENVFHVNHNVAPG